MLEIKLKIFRRIKRKISKSRSPVITMEDEWASGLAVLRLSLWSLIQWLSKCSEVLKSSTQSSTDLASSLCTCFDTYYQIVKGIGNISTACF